MPTKKELKEDEKKKQKVLTMRGPQLMRNLYNPDPVPTEKVQAAHNPKAGPGAMSEIARNAKTLWDLADEKAVTDQSSVGRGRPVSEESPEQRTTFRDMATTGLNPRYNPTATMSPESQVGAIKRRPGLQEKGSNMTLRDAAVTPPSTQRQRPATENTPYSVEMIRGLNRTIKDYAAGEDGGWGELARTRDYQKIPGMGERLAYDSTDPAYDPGLKYQQDQENAITLKELENKGKFDVQVLRNKGALQSKAATDKKNEAYKLSTEISKALHDEGGVKPVDLRTAAHELARLNEMDAQRAFELFTTMAEEHREKILDFWREMGII